ncbi:MAG: succinate dehydrogenase cytochrome b subunit [Bacteroidia bacterium]
MTKFLTSSLGKKTVMAMTGLFLCIFLLEHLYTNVQLFFGDGGKSFDEASHGMVHSIIIRIIEVVLFFSIIVHVYQAVVLTKNNSDARPVKYAVNGVSKTSNWFSRNMFLTGSIILFFTVVHLYNFFLPYRITGEVVEPAEQGEHLAERVAAALTNPYYAALYLISVLFLAFHLNHGFQSAFQTLGASTKKYVPILKMAGTAFAILIGIGFASFPILFFIFGEEFLNWNL